MIGEIHKALVPFFDLSSNRQSFKARPVLIIAMADAGDCVALPVSTVTRRQNLDPDFDIEVDPAIYPKTNLDHTSYVRTHKQLTVHIATLGGKIGDIKSEYEDLYLAILAKREEFSRRITEQALS